MSLCDGYNIHKQSTFKRLSSFEKKWDTQQLMVKYAVTGHKEQNTNAKATIY